MKESCNLTRWNWPGGGDSGNFSQTYVYLDIPDYTYPKMHLLIPSFLEVYLYVIIYEIWYIDVLMIKTPVIWSWVLRPKLSSDVGYTEKYWVIRTFIYDYCKQTLITKFQTIQQYGNFMVVLGPFNLQLGKPKSFHYYNV